MQNEQMKNAIAERPHTLLATQLDYILLDGSGSMIDKRQETISALRAFMHTLVAENIHSHGILHVFDSCDKENVQRDDIIREWEQLTYIDYPGGSTPLFDAINIMVRRLAELDPPRASIVIVTDGQENASKHTNEHQARALLDWCRDKGWQVTFLGADFNNSTQAQALGAEERNSIGVQKSRLVEAGKLLGEKRVRNVQSGANIDFSGEEKTTFGGYLTKQ